MSGSQSPVFSQKSSGRRTKHWIVEHARRPIPVPRLLVIPFIGALYGGLAAFHPIFGSSPLTVLLLTMLAMLTLGYALASPNADILDPMRVVSFYFFIAFCAAPLAMRGIEWHFTRPFTDILPAAVSYSTASYLMILVGYHVPFFRPIPISIEARNEGLNHSRAAVLAVILFAVGLASWVGLFLLAGGIDGLVYSYRARGEFFEGFGYLFWGSLLMFPGATLYWSAKCADRTRSPWIHITPLLIAFFAFLVLQGRMRAIGFLVLGLFVSHYMIRPLKPVRLALYGALALLLALFIGVARAPSTRADAFADPVATVSVIIENFDEAGRALLTADLSRLQQIVLIIDKVPSSMPHDWGRSFFFFLNPWLRMFGASDMMFEGIGPRLFRLARPDAGPLPTGYLPSLLGEMLVNFPWPIACVLFVPYGIAIRWLYGRLVVDRGDFLSVAVYAVVLLQVTNTILQSLSLVVLETLIGVVPLVFIGLACRFGQRARNRYSETLR